MRGDLPSPSALAAALLIAFLCSPATAQDDWLSWSATRAEALGKAMRQSGRVGGYFDMRVKGTNKSYNFKLRATWLTPEVIRAGARLIQLQERLSDDEARQLVARGEDAADTIILVELDPREGSGVIPLGWTAHFQPKDRPQGLVVKGSLMPRLRDVPVLNGVDKRDYAYDVFWVGFSLERDGVPLSIDVLPDAATENGLRIGRIGAAPSIPPSESERIVVRVSYGPLESLLFVITGGPLAGSRRGTEMAIGTIQEIEIEILNVLALTRIKPHYIIDGDTLYHNAAGLVIAGASSVSVNSRFCQFTISSSCQSPDEFLRSVAIASNATLFLKDGQREAAGQTFEGMLKTELASLGVGQ